jgi:hypothetical protein
MIAFLHISNFDLQEEEEEEEEKPRKKAPAARPPQKKRAASESGSEEEEPSDGGGSDYEPDEPIKVGFIDCWRISLVQLKVLVSCLLGDVLMDFYYVPVATHTGTCGDEHYIFVAVAHGGIKAKLL